MHGLRVRKLWGCAVSMFKGMTCLVLGHHYHPCYTLSRGKVQYKCECCGYETPWLTPREHKEFNAQQKPTWEAGEVILMVTELALDISSSLI